MTLGPLAFLSPWLLAALITLPIIYWLLRAVPPRPATVAFPPTRILVGLENDEKTADKTPWWLTLIRLLAATLVILALADPVLNPSKNAALKGSGPVVIVADNGWASAAHWAERATMIDRLISEAESAQRAVIVLPTASTSKTVTPKIEAPVDARNTAAARYASVVSLRTGSWRGMRASCSLSSGPRRRPQRARAWQPCRVGAWRRR